MKRIMFALFSLIVGAALAIGYRATENAPSEALLASQTDAAVETVQLENPFVIPLMKQGKVWSYIVLSIALELHGDPEKVRRHLPKIRNSILEILMSPESLKKFEYDFHGVVKNRKIHQDIDIALKKVIGSSFKSVLIVEVNRNDL